MNLIGSNTGICIRTKVAHSFQCQWTLVFSDKDISSIQVAGREFDEGLSAVSIIGGTGQYQNIQGEMHSINNGDGTFRQTLNYMIKALPY